MTEERKLDSGTMVAGFVLIVVGTGMLLLRFTDLDFGDLVSGYWAVIIIVVGLAKLVSRDGFWGGLWTIAVGSWLLAAHNHFYGLTYRNSWPLLLIVLGGGMIVRGIVDALARREERHGQ